jgi:hypothetical protein
VPKTWSTTMAGSGGQVWVGQRSNPLFVRTGPVHPQNFLPSGWLPSWNNERGLAQIDEGDLTPS